MDNSEVKRKKKYLKLRSCSSSEEEDEERTLPPPLKKIKEPLAAVSSSSDNTSSSEDDDEDQDGVKEQNQSKRLEYTDDDDEDIPNNDDRQTERISSTSILNRSVNKGTLPPVVDLATSNSDMDGPDHTDTDNESPDGYDEDSGSGNTEEDSDSGDMDVTVSDAERNFDAFVSPDPGFFMTNASANRSKARSKTRKKNQVRKPKKVRRISTKSHSDEDSEEDPFVILPDKAQALSIHQINLDKFLDCNNEEEIISRIIEKYNLPKNKKKSEHPFLKRDVKRMPKLSKRDEKLFKGEEFKIKIFIQTVSKGIPVLKSYGVDEDKANLVHSLIFHYRSDEIFVFTTGQAWNAVQWCSDFEFPGKIADRILSEKGELESTKKGLVGTELVSKQTHKHEQEANPYELLSFCTSFTAEIRSNASILKLSCFQRRPCASSDQSQETPRVLQPAQRTDATNGSDDEDDMDSGQGESLPNPTATPASPLYNVVNGIKVIVSLGAIRILNRFKPSDFLGILSILSLIAEGKKTQDLNGKDELDSTAHTKYLAKVETEACKELNNDLAKMVHDALSDNNKMYKLENYEICHKHFEDFFHGCNFRLYYKAQLVETWKDRPPSCSQVVTALKNTDLGVFDRKDVGQGEGKFLKRLDSVKIAYTVRGKGTGNEVMKKEKLMNFIEGMMFRSSDNCVYWHVQGHWYYVREVYLLLVQTQFLNVLKNSLLTEEEHHPAKLKKPWPTLEQQGDKIYDDIGKSYLNLFKNQQDTYVNVMDEGLFDMIKLSPKTYDRGGNSIFLYYLMPGLYYNTISKGVEITNAILKLRKACMDKESKEKGRKSVGGTDRNLQQLRAVYCHLVDSKPRFKTAFPNVEKFQDTILQAEVFLLVGPTIDKENPDLVQRTLFEESNIEPKMTTEDIRLALAAEIPSIVFGQPHTLTALAANLKKPVHMDECKGLAEALEEVLKVQGYLDRLGGITGKFLGQSRSSFELKGLGRSINVFVFEKIVKPFQPQCSTMLAKLELIRMESTLKHYGVKHFHIFEIPKD